MSLVSRLAALRVGAVRLARARRAVALVEFAYTLPLFTTMSLTGAELTNYVTTKMRVGQTALHLADHAARLGSGSLLQAKTISENDINDVLTGAGLQAGELELYTRGRVVISSLEPVASPNTTNRYKIVWQRCRGSAAYTRAYGTTGQTNMTGMGPAGRQVTAPDNGATMFVEVHYQYRPIVLAAFAPTTTMTEIASMTVRDRRDTSQVYNTEAVPVSAC